MKTNNTHTNMDNEQNTKHTFELVDVPCVPFSLFLSVCWSLSFDSLLSVPLVCVPFVFAETEIERDERVEAGVCGVDCAPGVEGVLTSLSVCLSFSFAFALCFCFSSAAACFERGGLPGFSALSHTCVCVWVCVCVVHALVPRFRQEQC